MFLHDKKEYPPLYTLPRKSWRRRRRLKKIIAMRRTHQFNKTPIGLLLLGWRCGVPVHTKRFHIQHWETNHFSVRGTVIKIPICKLKDSAIQEMIS